MIWGDRVLPGVAEGGGEVADDGAAVEGAGFEG